MPLMAELVMESQILKEPDIISDRRSHTGNSWNQSDIDEAYEKYYSHMPVSSETTFNDLPPPRVEVNKLDDNP